MGKLNIANLLKKSQTRNDSENVAFLVEQIRDTKNILDGGRLPEVDPAILIGARSQVNIFDEEGALLPSDFETTARSVLLTIMRIAVPHSNLMFLYL